MTPIVVAPPCTLCGHARGSHAVEVTAPGEGVRTFVLAACLEGRCVCDRYIPRVGDVT